MFECCISHRRPSFREQVSRFVDQLQTASHLENDDFFISTDASGELQGRDLVLGVETDEEVSRNIVGPFAELVDVATRVSVASDVIDLASPKDLLFHAGSAELPF